MKDSPPPTKRWRYDAAFRAEALRLAGESRSTQAAARALNLSPKLLYKWQREAKPSRQWQLPAGQSWTRLQQRSCAS